MANGIKYHQQFIGVIGIRLSGLYDNIGHHATSPRFCLPQTHRQKKRRSHYNLKISIKRLIIYNFRESLETAKLLWLQTYKLK